MTDPVCTGWWHNDHRQWQNHNVLCISWLQTCHLIKMNSFTCFHHWIC